MNRKHALIALVLAFVMVLGTMTTALAAYCMSCGTQLPDGANFCYNCGAKQDGSTSGNTTTTTTTTTAASNGMQITKITENGDGSLSVRWTDTDGNAPYDVYYVQLRSDDFDADVEVGTGYWTCAEDLTTRSATISNAVPGQDYWIVVANKNGDYVYQAFYAGTVSRFYEFNTDISIILKYRRNGAYTEVGSFSASDIARNKGNTTYGAYIRLDYPRLARARNYAYMVAITAPNGEVVLDGYGTMELSAGRSYTYWNDYSLDWYFDILTQYYGTVPTGTYTWSLYYDGLFVSSQNFRITN